MRKEQPILFSLRLDSALDKIEYKEFDLVVWRPTLTSLFPIRVGRKYVLFSIFSIFRIGSFRAYFCQSILNYGGESVASLLVLPKFFSYPFMSKKDVQMIYVVVDEKFRGKGLGKILVNGTLEYLQRNTDIAKVWYITTEDNFVSQKLAVSSGFENNGYGKRISFKRIIRKES